MERENALIRPGREKLIQQFLADNITCMFGNPGTVEEGFLDAIADFPEFQYVTCLHEAVAVAMADGYARKANAPALVQLHSGVGLGNGIGLLYQAYRGHSPLIIIAGEAGVRYDGMDAWMACDLVAMAKPVTKYAVRVLHKDSLLRLVRRAIKIAMTPPRGPVFLSLPMDVLDEMNTEEICPSISIEMDSCPRKEVLEHAAELLYQAVNPVILAGDGVSDSDAVRELEECAELLAAKVYGVNSSCINISQTSPCYQGDLGHMFGENSAEKIKDADVILVIGTYLFPEIFPSIENPLPKGATVIHIDLDTFEIAKNHPISLGIAASPKAALEGLNCLLKEKKICKREERFAVLVGTEKYPDNPSSPASPVLTAFLQALSEYNDDHLVLFDEAISASPHVLKYLPKSTPGTFFQTRGGSLGVGIPGAMGICMSDPSSNVVVFTGDGASMYTIQALYTAMRNCIPVKVIVCKNGSYRYLEGNLKRYWNENQLIQRSMPDCFRLFDENVDIDFVSLARSMGVEARSASTAEEAAEAAKSMIQADKAYLVELTTTVS